MKYIKERDFEPCKVILKKFREEDEELFNQSMFKVGFKYFSCCFSEDEVLHFKSVFFVFSGNLQIIGANINYIIWYTYYQIPFILVLE